MVSDMNRVWRYALSGTRMEQTMNTKEANASKICNRHMARTLSNLRDAGCPQIFVDAVESNLRWLRSDLCNLENQRTTNEETQANG